MPLDELRSFRTRRVVAWLLVGVTVLACVAQVVLLIAAGVPLFSAESWIRHSRSSRWRW